MSGISWIFDGTSDRPQIGSDSTPRSVLEFMLACDEWLADNLQGQKSVLVRMTEDDHRFITTYDPTRERIANRATLVSVVEEIQAIVAEGTRPR